MSPTNPMFAKFDQALGKTTPTVAGAPKQSRADEIRALANTSTDSESKKLGQGAVGEFSGNAVRSVAEPLLNVGGGIQKILTGGKAKQTGIETAKQSSTQHAKGAAGALGDIVGTVAPYFTGAGEEEMAAKVATMLPKLAETLGIKVDSLIPKVVGYLTKRTPEIVKNTAVGTAQTGDPVQGVENAIGAEGVTGAIKAAPAVSKAITGAFKGKTPEEILATSEDKLSKLSAEDRKFYFDTQKEQAAKAHATQQDAITQKHTQLESQIKAEGEKKIADLSNETQNLVNQADRASIDEAQSLKPKVIKAMGENSKTYRELVDKEIAPVRDEEVAHTDLWKFITERNLDNPTKAAELAKSLGLTEGKTSTIGDIYDQLKGLKQDIGAAGRKGTRVLTPDEIKTSDSIAILSDYLKNEKGIDFTEANKFWSQYAPLRDKLIKNVQPFTPQGAESGTFGTFTKDIQNYVSGIKEGKVDFISATENLLGTKIGNPKTRAALEKLTTNQKAQFAAKLEQENKLSDAKLLRDQQMKDAEGKLSETKKGISDKEFEANRQAQTRKNIWKTIAAITGGAIGLEELKRLTGL